MNSILVVDDTIENVRLLVRMLTEQGYEARPVTNARHALQAVAHAPPDLILLDINMPEMNGFEVSERIREMKLGDIPVIFLTALTDAADKVRAFEAGGVDYITKPFQIEEVLARVKVHLALRRTRADLRESYQRLSALEVLRDDLVKMIVHDMRSPLAALIGNLELLQMEIEGVISEQSAEGLRDAIQSAAGLNRMANDLLDVSRLEAGQMPVHRQVIDLAGLAESVRASLSALDRGRSIELSAEGPVEVDCDEGIIRRVIENLLSNAIKHTPPRSRVWISVATAGERARLVVRDEGPGVPLAVRTKIFEKFGSLATRRDGSFHSVGLGLAFSKLAVEAHGGTIGIDDGDPVGSAFWFELPTRSPVP